MTLLSRCSTATLRFWLAGMLSIGIVTGCVTLPQQPAKIAEAGLDVRALFDQWLTRRNQNQTLQGLAKIRVQTPDQTVNGTQVLLVEKPARLRAETLSPFGTPLLVLTANEAEFSVLATGDSRFYQGRPTMENLGRFIRLPLHLADLVGILLFQPPLIAYDSAKTAQLPDGGWMVALESGPARQELQFDTAHRLVGVRYLSGAELQLRLVYSDFAEDLGNAPRRIDLELPQKEFQATLVFRELEMNRPIRPEVFTLVAPPGATVMFLDEPAARPPENN